MGHVQLIVNFVRWRVGCVRQRGRPWVLDPLRRGPGGAFGFEVVDVGVVVILQGRDRRSHCLLCNPKPPVPLKGCTTPLGDVPISVEIRGAGVAG